MSTAAFSASLGVDAIVAILLAVKIFEVQRIAKENYTVQKRTVHPIRNYISIFNDSGILMLGCLIIWVTFFRINSVGFVLIKGPIVMIYVSRIKIFLLPLFPLLLNVYACSLSPTLIHQRVTLPIAQTSSREKPRNHRSTSVRFAIWEGGLLGDTCMRLRIDFFFLQSTHV